MVVILCGLPVGCGSGIHGTLPTPVAPVAPTNALLTGNWEFALYPAAGQSAASLPFYKLSGALAGGTSNSPLTGQMQAFSSVANNCVTTTSIIGLNGTIDASGNVVLTSSTAGGYLSIYGIYNDPLAEIFGVLNVAGGNCNLGQTGVQGYRLASLTGTWIGTFQNTNYPPSGAPTSTVTAVLNQSATPNPDGTYALTGTVTSTGNCSGSYSFANGAVTGGSYNSEAKATSTQSSFTGALPRFTFTTIPLSTLSLMSCSATESGSLTKQ